MPRLIGAVVTTQQQVILESGDTIPGLYGVGNCASPISGDAYYSGGTTLGTAMVSGFTAGGHVVLSSHL